MSALVYAPTAVSLLDLPAPSVVQTLDFEAIVADMKVDFSARWEVARAKDPTLPTYDVGMLETDPAVVLIEAFAYREMLLRARINDAARSLLVAFAKGSDLDHLGAQFGVTRDALVADPRPYLTNPEDWESDDRFRRRVQLAPEAFSTAGSQGSYIFYGLTVDASVYDAWAWRPAPGKVEVVLAGEDGTPVSDDVVAKLVDLFARADKIPLTDQVAVRKAEVLGYTVSVLLQIPRGPDPKTIEDKAADSIRTYTSQRLHINENVYLAGLYAAAKVGGVENVVVRQPLADVVSNDRQIPKMTGLSVASQVL